MKGLFSSTLPLLFVLTWSSSGALATQGMQAPATLPAPALISPANGVEMHGYPRLINFQWSVVAGAESYSIEIDCLGCCDRQTWCSNNGRTGYIVRGLEVPGYSFSFWGDQPGKWRVWANAPSGDGNPSEWRNFTFTTPRDVVSLPAPQTMSQEDCSWRSALRPEPGTIPAALTDAPMPVYSSATEQKVNAVVSLEAKVGTDGKLESICILHSPRADLNEATISAVKKWRFIPARKEDVAVPSLVHLEIRFRACCDEAVLFYPKQLPATSPREIAAASKPTATSANDVAGASKPVATDACASFRTTPEPGTTPPKGVYTPEAEYTDAGRKSKLSGDVVLLVKVAADGRVEDACVARSLREDLDESAVRTIKTWRFEPAQRNGASVAYISHIEVSFHIR